VGPVLLVVVGITVFVVAFFGCCGAVKENHCMIMTVSKCGFCDFVFKNIGFTMRSG
jgi:CD63 antigen